MGRVDGEEGKRVKMCEKEARRGEQTMACAEDTCIFGVP